MNKKILVLLTAILLCVVFTIPCCAQSNPLKVVDNADLLTDAEESMLLDELTEISERQQFDVVVYTTYFVDGYSAQSCADDYYDYNGYGYGSEYDGAILYVAIEDREWHISTCGYGTTALTDVGIECIGEEITPYMSDGDFYSAFHIFAVKCDEFVTSSRNGDAYDVDNVPKESYDFFADLIISLIFGLVVALIAVIVMMFQLKSVRFQGNAADYVKTGSLNITDAREYFLYSNVSKQKKVETSSSGGSTIHRSSSGRSHGGGGGRF